MSSRIRPASLVLLLAALTPVTGAPDPPHSSTDEVLIYTEVLHTLKGNPFVQQETELGAVWLKRTQDLYAHKLGVPGSLLSAFRSVNTSAARSLYPGRELPDGTLTITASTYRADPCRGWDAFIGDFPSINGLAILSLIAFEPNHSRALVHAARVADCRSSTRVGRLYLLEKAATGWRIAQSIATS